MAKRTKQAKRKPARTGRLIVLVTIIAVVVALAATQARHYLADNQMHVCTAGMLEGQPVMICMSPAQFYESLAEAAEIQKQATPAVTTNDLEKQI